MVFHPFEPRFDSFEWDDAKFEANLLRHGFDFRDVLLPLLQPHLVQQSNRGGEARHIGLVSIGSRRVAAIYTIRGDACRVISVRAARDYEREAYDAGFVGGS